MFKVGDTVRHHRCTDADCPSLNAEFVVQHLDGDDYVNDDHGYFEGDELELVESAPDSEVTPDERPTP